MGTPIVLHCFPEVVRTAFDQDLRDNCPVRALTLYLKKTETMRLDNQLFVGFGSKRLGKAVSKQTLAKWISQVIRRAYARMGRPDPVKCNPHTTRGVAASWAELARVGMPAICEAATWSSSLSFARYYRLDFAGSTVSSAILHLAST